MADRVDIQNVLGQMRALKAQAQQGVGTFPVRPQAEIQPAAQNSFGDLLKMAVDKVNETQQAATKLTQAYEKGDPSVDLPEVMIGLQKASVSFQAMTQVRNRLVTAYEDISKMPI
ncbi:flagellar hook-basal body complex protein FliE [Motiliproteus sp. SC1-56]|uniref:flagellar hook-basal body complex protein FliE n=1 Tax=Motiliproteus sp. SC1-56 TaxID=2799565 RepID=UPI001A903EFE|nr:flagellar hook-basal body complex protein FliE [Motiliproteus sp. SC1-56]